jgi:transcriptional regulator with XRE-family HTH domain
VASATADRIRAYCTEQGISLRKLSAAAFDNPTQLGMMLKRLDDGSSVAVDVLERVAQAMGITLGQLRGEQPSEKKLRDVDGWATAAAEARARFRVDAVTLAEVGDTVFPSPPSRVTAAFVVAIARAILDARTT